MHSSPLEKLVRKTTCTSVDSILCEEKKNWRRRKIRSNSKETVLFFRLFSSIPPPFFSPSLPPRFFSFHTSNRDKGKIKEEEEKSEERRRRNLWAAFQSGKTSKGEESNGKGESVKMESDWPSRKKRTTKMLRPPRKNCRRGNGEGGGRGDISIFTSVETWRARRWKSTGFNLWSWREWNNRWVGH